MHIQISVFVSFPPQITRQRQQQQHKEERKQTHIHKQHTLTHTHMLIMHESGPHLPRIQTEPKNSAGNRQHRTICHGRRWPEGERWEGSVLQDHFIVLQLHCAGSGKARGPRRGHNKGRVTGNRVKCVTRRFSI